MITARSRSKAAALLLFAMAAATSSCKKDSAETSAPAVPEDPQKALVSRGRTIYQSVCIACHNSDPKKAGTLGPDVWGSSLALLQARVIDGNYPAGYTPKRTTHVMQPLPQVQKDLPAIQAYLNAQP
jgi:mono/diheme cytochrome c family protein